MNVLSDSCIPTLASELLSTNYEPHWEPLRVLAGSSVAKFLSLNGRTTEGNLQASCLVCFNNIYFTDPVYPETVLDSKGKGTVPNKTWPLVFTNFKILWIQATNHDAGRQQVMVEKSFISDGDRWGSYPGFGSQLLGELRQLIRFSQTSVFLYIQWRWTLSIW